MKQGFYIGQRVRVTWGYCGPDFEVGREGTYMGFDSHGYHLVHLDGDEEPAGFLSHELEIV